MSNNQESPFQKTYAKPIHHSSQRESPNLFFAGILLFIIVLLPFDTYEFLNKPKDYIHVYDLDTTQKFWQL